MGHRVSRELEAGILATPGLIEHGKPVHQPPPPAADCDEVEEFMPRVIALAKQLGWRCYHTHNSRRSTPGFPDLVLVRVSYLKHLDSSGSVEVEGRVIFAELKTEAGKESKAQRAWRRDLEAAGRCEAYLWRPSNWNQIVEILK